MSKDWHAEYMLALNEIGRLRGDLSFIGGYTRSIIEAPQPTLMLRHIQEINARVKAALDGGKMTANDKERILTILGFGLFALFVIAMFQVCT